MLLSLFWEIVLLQIKNHFQVLFDEIFAQVFSIDVESKNKSAQVRNIQAFFCSDVIKKWTLDSPNKLGPIPGQMPGQQPINRPLEVSSYHPLLTVANWFCSFVYIYVFYMFSI